MKIKKPLAGFVIVFVITFVVFELVYQVWRAIANGEGYFNWGTPVRFAITACIVLPILYLWKRKKKNSGGKES
jgi:hypothetical protein